MAIYSTALRYMIHLLALCLIIVGVVFGNQFYGPRGAGLGLLAAFLVCGLWLGTIALLFEIRDNLVRLNNRGSDGEARPQVNRREPQLAR
jgi:hypothetical protein